MNRVDADKIWKEVRANAAKLNKCPEHDFSIEFSPYSAVPAMKRYRCSKCGGDVDVSAKLWYEKGLKHGKGEK